MSIYARRFLAVLLVLGWIASSYGMDASIITNTVTVTYTEPTLLQDGRTLTDLSHTTIKPVLQDLAGNESALPTIQIPATVATGGGAVNHQFDVQVQEDYVILKITATATRDTGAESIPSTEAVVVIDRVPPNPPQ